jgi:MFS family permease
MTSDITDHHCSIITRPIAYSTWLLTPQLHNPIISLNMAGSETITLHEPQHLQTNTSDDAEQATRQRDLDKKRLFALTGAALSQLPIWGEYNTLPHQSDDNKFNVGFAMSYGVLQEYYFDHWTLEGGRELTGIIGTTSNGVMYMSMPFLFALFTKRGARYRQTAAICGALIACGSFVLSAFSKHVWHLIATQGVLAALGCALMYSPLTLSLGEWFNTENRICNRAVAFGLILSTKNVVGSVCPFVFRGLLDKYGFHTSLLVWAAMTAGTGIAAILMIRTPAASMTNTTTRGRKIPWQFLRHRTFWIYSTATLVQSAGYGIPQTYLSEYARNVSALSPTFSTLLLTLINIPGICSSTFFGFLSDNKHFHLAAPTVTALSAISSALAAFLFWGLAAHGDIALLVLFAITFGFFASAYSATWGGVMNDMERDAARRNEALDSGVLYGLLNGARGIGYVSGGLVSVPLIKAGSASPVGSLGYGTTYGPLIIFTGLSLAFGGWGLAFAPGWKKMLHLR